MKIILISYGIGFCLHIFIKINYRIIEENNRVLKFVFIVTSKTKICTSLVFNFGIIISLSVG